MGDPDAREGPRVQQSSDRDTNSRPDDGVVPASPSPTRDPTAAADDELLCTICGLRACWQ